MRRRVGKKLAGAGVVLWLAAPMAAGAQSSAQVPAAPAAPAAQEAAAPIPDTDGWIRLGEVNGKAYYTLVSPPVGAMARIWLRVESLGAGDKVRSMLTLDEFDCTRPRMRSLQMNHYAQNGLVEEISMTRAPGPWDAIKPDTMEATVRTTLCDGKKPRPPSNDIDDPNGAFAWFGIEPLGWIEYTRDDVDVTFIMPGPKGEFARVWTRTETRVQQDGALAITRLYDVDCKTAKMRVIQMARYEGYNLSGEIDVDTDVKDWTFVVPGSLGEALQQDACGVTADAPVSAPADAAKPAAVKL